MWIRCKIATAVGLLLLPLLFATAAAQGDDKPIVQNAAPGKFQKIPNLPDCITAAVERSEEHTSELQSLAYLVCRLLLEKKKKNSVHMNCIYLLESVGTTSSTTYYILLS